MAQKILVTGAAGFIGYHLCEALLTKGYVVFGLDNINDYYDPELKYSRLLESGILKDEIHWHTPVQSTKYTNYHFIRMNLEDKLELNDLFKNEEFDIVINLAAQAGVRYSIENPDAYIQSNIVGFLNILEAVRNFRIKHLVYASSSSVYGLNESMPFSEKDNVSHPVSLYAATKRSNELMAHAYSSLYNIPTSGLRFFTVYGPWGRPDMAYFLFAEAIREKRPIKVFNQGKMKRDFTYIDDIVDGIINISMKPAEPDLDWSGLSPNPSSSKAPYRLFNIGNNTPVELMSFINELGNAMGEKPEMQMLEMQAGDVSATWADVDALISVANYKPETPISQGLRSFVKWYKEYRIS